MCSPSISHGECLAQIYQTVQASRRRVSYCSKKLPCEGGSRQSPDHISAGGPHLINTSMVPDKKWKIRD